MKWLKTKWRLATQLSLFIVFWSDEINVHVCAIWFANNQTEQNANCGCEATELYCSGPSLPATTGWHTNRSARQLRWRTYDSRQRTRSEKQRLKYYTQNMKSAGELSCIKIYAEEVEPACVSSLSMYTSSHGSMMFDLKVSTNVQSVLTYSLFRHQMATERPDRKGK